MDTVILTRGQPGWPQVLEQMHKKPTHLYVRGAPLGGLLSKQRVAIVGSRRMTAYGKQITAQWSRQLAEQGVVIISGLANGVDAEAHWSALKAGGLTIAVLPSPVEDPVPYSNLRLAREILAKGGALVSTYPAGSENHKGNFVARNEVVAALSNIVLITEAATDSGSRHTVKFASDMRGVHVMAVPGNVDRPSSGGTNNWIANDKAKLAPNVQSVMKELGLSSRLQLPLHRGDTPEEQTLIDLVHTGVSDGEQLLLQSRLPVHTYNQTLTMLEVNGVLQPLGGNHWGLT